MAIPQHLGPQTVRSAGSGRTHRAGEDGRRPGLHRKYCQGTSMHWIGFHFSGTIIYIQVAEKTPLLLLSQAKQFFFFFEFRFFSFPYPTRLKIIYRKYVNSSFEATFLSCLCFSLS